MSNWEDAKRAAQSPFHDEPATDARIASPNICLCNSFKLHPSQRSLGMFSKITTALPPPLEKAESGGRSKKKGRFLVRQCGPDGTIRYVSSLSKGIQPMPTCSSGGEVMQMKTYYSGEHARHYNRTWEMFSQKTHAATLSLIDLTRLQHAASTPEHPPRFLDVACGTGLLLEQLIHLIPYAEVYGIDESEEMLSQARRLLENHPHAHLVQGTLSVGAIARLPYAPASFDVITCTNAFHYLKDPAGVLRELTPLLAPQGQFVIEDYARRRFPFPWRLFEWKIKQIDPRHVRAYTLTEAQDLCRQAGVQVVSTETFHITVVWHGWALRAEATPC